MFGIGLGELVILVLFALFWAVVVVLVISMLRWIVGGGQGRNARRILDERYARGELAREDYERMRRDIGAG